MRLANVSYPRVREENIYAEGKIESQPDDDNWSKTAGNFGCSEWLNQE